MVDGAVFAAVWHQLSWGRELKEIMGCPAGSFTDELFKGGGSNIQGRSVRTEVWTPGPSKLEKLACNSDSCCLGVGFMNSSSRCANMAESVLNFLKCSSPPYISTYCNPLEPGSKTSIITRAVKQWTFSRHPSTITTKTTSSCNCNEFRMKRCCAFAKGFDIRILQKTRRSFICLVQLAQCVPHMWHGTQIEYTPSY